MKLAKHLKELIRHADVTIAQVARKTGVPAKTLYKWVEGQNPRNIEQVKKVANFFDKTVDELCFGESEKHGRGSPLKDLEEEIFAGNFDVILRKAKL